MANRRYGRNQKRRHREAIKQLENKNKADQRRFMNINSDLEGKLAEYLALTECETCAVAKYKRDNPLRNAVKKVQIIQISA